MRKKPISLLFRAFSQNICFFSSRRPFSLDASNYIEYLPKKLPAKLLKPLPEFEQILDFDDKFGLANVEDAREILKHLKSTNFAYNFNDLRYFLKRLQEIYQFSQGLSLLSQDSAFKALLAEIKSRISQENSPFLGTFAYCLRHLDVEDQELWQLFEEKALNDEYYVNFQESFRLCEGFVKFAQIFKGNRERVDFLFEKVERNLGLTLWNANMLYFQRIAAALVDAGRENSRLFEKLQELVLSNLGMEYEIETFANIVLSFGRAGRGNRGFFEIAQKILANGHPLAPAFARKPENFGYDGEKIAEIVEIFARVRGRSEKIGGKLLEIGEMLEFSQRNTANFEFDPDFLVHLFKLLENRKTTFSAKSLIKILENVQVFEFEEEDRLFREIFAKINDSQRIPAKDAIKLLTVAKEKRRLREMSRKTRDFLEESLLDAVKHEKFAEMLRIFEFLKENALLSQENRWISLISQLLRENGANVQVFLEESRKNPEIYADFSQLAENLLEFKENLS